VKQAPQNAEKPCAAADRPTLQHLGAVAAAVTIRWTPSNALRAPLNDIFFSVLCRTDALIKLLRIC